MTSCSTPISTGCVTPDGAATRSRSATPTSPPSGFAMASAPYDSSSPGSSMTPSRRSSSRCWAVRSMRSPPTFPRFTTGWRAGLRHERSVTMRIPPEILGQVAQLDAQAETLGDPVSRDDLAVPHREEAGFEETHLPPGWLHAAEYAQVRPGMLEQHGDLIATGDEMDDANSVVRESCPESAHVTTNEIPPARLAIRTVVFVDDRIDEIDVAGAPHLFNENAYHRLRRRHGVLLARTRCAWSLTAS